MADVSTIADGHFRKRTQADAEIDSCSTDTDDSEPTVYRRLVKIPRLQGLDNVKSLLEMDMCNRYQAKKVEQNFLLQCEREFAKYLGMKYACALNSGGIAMSLALEGIKRVFFPDDRKEDIRLYSNAFTFHAVPSACVVAGFRETLKLIEATPELVIDLEYLENCIKTDLESGKFGKGKMILMLSYMRGRVPDMKRVLELCDKYSLVLLEDCAHGYGCAFEGKMCGSFGVVSTISTQANKIVNTGEGGMVFTNNAELQAFFIFSAGSYEELWRKHEEMAPPEDVALKYKYTTSNVSVRMTNIQGALMHPQLLIMTQRIDHHNAMYDYLQKCTKALLDGRYGTGSAGRVEFIPQAHELVTPVYDSLQIRIRQKDGKMAPQEVEGLNEFIKAMQARKYTMAKFNDPANARNYVSWQYLKNSDIKPEVLPQTTKVLLNVCDLRLLCHDTEQEMDKLAADMVDCLKVCFQ